MNHLMNTYARLPTEIVKGEGAWLIDQQGKRYLDALSGIGVCSLGHCHPEITEEITQQAKILLHCANIAHIPWQSKLSQKLHSISGLDQVFFANSGAEANECALKLARLTAKQKGIASPQILVTDGSFHGRTLACLSASGSRKVQAGFEPLVQGFIRVPFNNIDAIKQLSANPNDIVAIMIEPIQGEGGVVMPHPDYLKQLRALCDQHDWLLILDEVQTGMGKTGEWFAYQHSQILPDIVTTAKALGNGIPIAACIASSDVSNCFRPGNHGSTFGGNPLACRIACKVIDIIQRDQLLDRASHLGRAMLENFKKELSDSATVKNIRGQGLMIGIELQEACPQLKQQAFEQGLIINITKDKVIRLLPPLIIDDQQATHITSTVCKLIKEHGKY